MADHHRGFTCVKDATGRPGRLLVCAHREAAVVPAGDAQVVAGAGTAGPTAGCGWSLPAGADLGDGRGHRAEAVPARTCATLGARDDPGTPLQAHPASATTGDGQCCVREPGERTASVAVGLAGGAGLSRMACGISPEQARGTGS